MKNKLEYLALAVTLLITTQCSWKTPNTAMIQLGIEEFSKRRSEPNTDSRPSLNNPGTLGNMHCFFISVSGSGIVPSEGQARLNTRKPECFGLGTTTKGVKLTELVSAEGYRFSIPLGPNRQVSVFGAYSSELGTGCTEKDFGDLFGYPTRPRVYLLGRTNSDVYRDSAVQVKNAYDPLTADDLAETCRTDAGAKSEPGDPAAAPQLRGGRLLVGTARNNSDDNLFSLSYNDGNLQIRQSQYMGGEAQHFEVTRDHTHLLMTYNSSPDRALINTRLYRLETQGPDAGNFFYKGLSTTGNHKSPGFFGVDPVLPFFYPITANGVTTASFLNDATAYNSTDDRLQSNTSNVVAVGKYVYVLTQSMSAVTLARYTRDAATGVLTLDNPNAFSSGFGSNIPAEILFNGVDVFYLGIGTAVMAIKVDLTTGGLSLLGSTITLPSLSAYLQLPVRLMFDNKGANLYALTRDSSINPAGPGGFMVFPLNADGSLPLSPNRLITIPGVATSGAMDPAGRFIFYALDGSKTVNYFDLNETTPAPKSGRTFPVPVLTMTSVANF